jgi:hypothetical protein
VVGSFILGVLFLLFFAGEQFLRFGQKGLCFLDPGNWLFLA